MSLLTNWGYTLTEADTLPDMLCVVDYQRYTGRNSDGDDRVAAEIGAACAAIRNYVGWHLYPALGCKVSTILSDRRITMVGRDALIQLPARLVSEVTAVSIDGVNYTGFFADPSGILRVFDIGYADSHAFVEVTYTAGLTEAMMAPIKELIAHRVTHSIAVPPGITSEASGGVSVTYNANWINNSRATALAGDNKELLIPYRVLGVF